MRVEIKYDKGRFLCNLTARFTRIHDENETGKTTINNLIKNMKSNNVVINCKLPVRCVQSLFDIRLNRVLFIDEDVIADLGCDIISQYVENTESYFVVISRYDFNKIPYSVENIKRLYTYANTTSLIDAYPTIYGGCFNG